MDYNCDKHHHNGFGNGFLLGMIIGGGSTFLLATEKGRKILKMLTEEGLGKGEEFGRKFMDQYLGDMEDFEDEDMSPQEAHEIRKEAESASEHLSNPVKRVFRGIKKK